MKNLNIDKKHVGLCINICEMQKRVNYIIILTLVGLTLSSCALFRPKKERCNCKWSNTNERLKGGLIVKVKV